MHLTWALVAAAGVVTPKPAPTPDSGNNFGLNAISWDGEQSWPRFHTTDNTSNTLIAAVYDSVNNNRAWALDSTDVITEYNLVSESLFSNVTAGSTLNVSSVDNAPLNFCFGSNGTRLYLTGSQNNRVYQFNLATAYDIATASYAKTYDPKTVAVVWKSSTDIKGIAFNHTGRRMYLLLRAYGLSSTNVRAVLQFSLDTAWEIDSARWEGAANYPKLAVNNVSSGLNLNIVTGLRISATGNTMFFISDDSNRIVQINLTDPFNLGGISLQGYLSTQSLTTSPRNIYVSPAGHRLYLIGLSGTVYQYNMSMPFDINSATYTGQTSYVGTSSLIDERYPTSLYFSSDGTRMYIAGNTKDLVVQLRLSSPWEVNTAVWQGANARPFLNYSSFERDAHGIYWHPDGSRFFLLGKYSGSIPNGSRANVYDFSVTEAFKFAGFAEQGRLGVKNQETNMVSITFSPDGTNMYLCGTYRQRIYRYTGPAWQPTAMSFAGFLSVGSRFPSYYSVQGVGFRPDGRRMFMVSSNGSVFFYTLPNPWDITTAVYEKKTSKLGIGPNDFRFSPDGTKMYYSANWSNGRIRLHHLGTAFDPSTSYRVDEVYLRNITLPLWTSGYAYSADINNSGTVLTVIAGTPDTMFRYRLTTPWFLPSAVYETGATDSFALTGSSSTASLYNITGLAFSPDGRIMYGIQNTAYDSYSSVVSGGYKKICQYSLATPWEINSASYVASINLNSNYVGYEATYSMDITNDGRYVYIGTGTYIIRLKLNTPFQITTAQTIPTNNTVDSFYQVYVNSSNPSDLTMQPDGRKMFICNAESNLVKEYNLNTPWLISSATSTGTTVKSFSSLLTCKFTAGGEAAIVASRNNFVTKVDLTTPFTIGTAQPPTLFYDSPREGPGYDSYLTNGKFRFTQDGLRLYINTGTNNYQLYFPREPFNALNAAPQRQFTVARASTPGGFAISVDNTFMFVPSYSNYLGGARIEQWLFNSNGGITSTSNNFIRSLLVAPETQPRAVSVRNDGGMLWVLCGSRRSVRAYQTSQPYNIGTAIFSAEYFLPGQISDSLVDMVVSQGGKKILIAVTTTGTGGSVHELNLTRAFDITTAAWVRSFNHYNVSHFTRTMGGIDVSSDGKKLFIAKPGTSNSGKIFTYTLAT